MAPLAHRRPTHETMNDNVNRNWPSGQNAAEAGPLTAARSNQIEAVQDESNQLKPKSRTTGSGTFTAPGPVKRIRRSAPLPDLVATINRLFGWHQHPRNGKVARLGDHARPDQPHARRRFSLSSYSQKASRIERRSAPTLPIRDEHLQLGSRRLPGLAPATAGRAGDP